MDGTEECEKRAGVVVVKAANELGGQRCCSAELGRVSSSRAACAARQRTLRRGCPNALHSNREIGSGSKSLTAVVRSRSTSSLARSASSPPSASAASQSRPRSAAMFLPAVRRQPRPCFGNCHEDGAADRVVVGERAEITQQRPRVLPPREVG